MNFLFVSGKNQYLVNMDKIDHIIFNSEEIVIRYGDLTKVFHKNREINDFFGLIDDTSQESEKSTKDKLHDSDSIKNLYPYLSNRFLIALYYEKINTIGDLLSLGVKGVKRLHRIGPLAMKQIVFALEKHGLRLKDE